MLGILYHLGFCAHDKKYVQKQTYSRLLCNNTGCIAKKVRIHFYTLTCIYVYLKEYANVWDNPYRICEYASVQK